MKTHIRSLMMPFLFLLAQSATVLAATPDASTGVPGDNFSLEGALELFKKSASPQEFEQLLNSADANVNNLDLNGDGNTDYIKVIDQNQGNVHAFILQAVISETESQDVAVIELEKQANGKAVLQITGDEDIYGVETIIEPTQEVNVYAGTSTARTIVNVWAWPSVQYVYSPYYSPWVSPWRWAFRPVWWRPWRPVAYQTYYSQWNVYRPYYSPCYTHRVVYAQQLYRPYRSTSVIVYNNHHNDIVAYRSNHYANNHNGYRNDNGNRTRNDYNHGSGYDHNNNNHGRDSYDNNNHNRNNWSSGRSNNDQRNNMNNNSRSDFNNNNNNSHNNWSRPAESRSFSNDNRHRTDVQQRQWSTPARTQAFNTERHEAPQRSFSQGNSGSREGNGAGQQPSRSFGGARSFQPSSNHEGSRSMQQQFNHGGGGSSASHDHSRGGRH